MDEITQSVVDAEIFESNRPRLFSIALRMLRSRADAEDVLQEAYLRWHQRARRHIESPIAFLVTITGRLCLDRLHDRKRQRPESVDSCPFDPGIGDHVPSQEVQMELQEEVSGALLAVLERLGREERTAFLLHDVFDYDYREVARILRRTESTCRQVIHRARTRLRDSRIRFAVAAESHRCVVERFIAATRSGDREAVMSLLAE